MQLFCGAKRWRHACAQWCREVGGCALVVAVLATAACQSDVATKVAPETSPEEPGTAATDIDAGVSVDRIAFVNPTGDLFTSGPEGKDIRPLTGGTRAGAGATGPVMAQPLDLDNFYAWPTWSPDGSKIAASHVLVSAGQAQISIQVIETENGSTKTVYTNQIGSGIARGVPHYVYWSPDNRHLAFLAVTEQGQTLFAKDTLAQEEAVALETGAPLYFNWATDGGFLLVHDGPEVKLASKPFGTGNPPLTNTTAVFRPPALSPDDQRFAYAQETEGGWSLLVAPVGDPNNGVNVLSVGPRSAFMWSPNGENLAIVDQEDLGNDIFQRLRVVSPATGQVRSVSEEQVLAFYWSPQGDKIAWIALDIEARTFVWRVMETSDGPTVELFRYRPSDDALTMFAHFDQYARSHSPWSPDGAHLVVTGTAEQPLERRNGATPTGDRVFILDATGAEAPHNIAAGIMAFWSWN